MKMKNTISIPRLLPVAMMALVVMFTTTVYGATPGITGTGTVATFNLTAQTAFLNQPDGARFTPGIWLRAGQRLRFSPRLLPPQLAPRCKFLPTLIVSQGQRSR